MSVPHAAGAPPAPQRNRTRKIVMGLAIACFVAAIVCGGLFAWATFTLGFGHIASASLLATTVFLASCSVVIYVMSMPPRPYDGGGNHDAG